MNVSYISVVIIIILLLFMLMIWSMFNGLREVLINDVEEAIIAVGEDIGERVDNVQKTFSESNFSICDIENYTLHILEKMYF